MRYRALLLGVMVWLLVCVLASADVPRLINFQGRLTDASGKFVPDGNYSLTFRIYSDSTGGSVRWFEGQLVALSKGLFNVILGSVNPIPDSIFNNLNTYLGIQVGADPEMTPRQRLSSIGYAYRGAKADTSNYSKDSDKLDGLHASDFSSVGTDYGRSGVAVDLYEGTTRLIDKYLQQGQLSSVNSSMIVDSTIANVDISATANISPTKISGTAWTSTNDGSSSGLDADLLDGQQGSYYTNAANISSGVLGDGRLSANVDLLNGAQTFTGVKTFNPGSGSVPFAVDATKNGAVTNLNADLLDGQHASAFLSTGGDYGRSGVAADLYEGSSTLTSKYVNVAGPDSVYASSGSALKGRASGGSSVAMAGIEGYAENNANGPAFGGSFSTSPSGTGTHYGVISSGYGSTSTSTYGVNGYSSNSSSGNAYGGFFSTSNSGTGQHYGLRAEGLGSSNAWTYGIYGRAENASLGDSYGGYFISDSAGTGTHYGARAEGYGASNANTYGSYGFGLNSSTGYVYGGYFQTSSVGTGLHFGVYGEGYSTSSGHAYGCYGVATSTSTGFAYGGSFRTNYSGTGPHYGVSGIGYGSSWNPVYGCDGLAENTSTGSAIGGYFQTTSAGTGTHYGVRGDSYSEGSTAIGVMGYAVNTSTDYVYGGNFYGSSSGTGMHYGVLAGAVGTSDSTTYGLYGDSWNLSSGDVYAGYFESYPNGTGNHYGIYAVGKSGSPANSFGSFGKADNSSTGTSYGGYFEASSSGTGYHLGVSGMGFGTTSTPTYGVYGYAYNSSNGPAYAGYFLAPNDGTGTKYGLYAEAPTSGWAGYFSGDAGVSNNMYVYNNQYVYGTKSAAVKVDDGEYRAMYSQESAEVLFEDFGDGELANGRATVNLDPLFVQTANTQIKYRVYLTPEGDCKGLYVTNNTPNSFEVRELQGGTSNITFNYRIVAKRKGYEDVRLAKVKGPALEEIALEQAKQQAAFEKQRANMNEENEKREERSQKVELNRIKMEQQTLEMEKQREKIRPEQGSFPIQNKK